MGTGLEVRAASRVPSRWGVGSPSISGFKVQGGTKGKQAWREGQTAVSLSWAATRGRPAGSGRYWLGRGLAIDTWSETQRVGMRPRERVR